MLATEQVQAEADRSKMREVGEEKRKPAKNRGRIEVIADIVRCCARPSSKSHIMLSANVNSIVATRTITKLAETGLLDSVHDDANVLYMATPRGFEFVRIYSDLISLLSPKTVPSMTTGNGNRLESLIF